MICFTWGLHGVLNSSPGSPRAPSWGPLLWTIYVECDILTVGWGPDLWLGLKCLFNEQRLCPSRVSFTNEWVTVSQSLWRLCLFIISQIHSFSLWHPFTWPGWGSSLDHLGCQADTLARSHNQCLDFKSGSLAAIQNYTVWKRSKETQAGLPWSVKLSFHKALQGQCTAKKSAWIPSTLGGNLAAAEHCQNSYSILSECIYKLLE